jgi:hypothetical protein
MIPLALVCALLLYLVWWEALFSGINVASLATKPIEASYRFNHWLPRFLLWVQVRDPVRRAKINKAVCLPHPFRRKVVVLVARHYIRGRQRKHEVIGHGTQVVEMGPVDYLFTYVWHYIIRFGSWINHMMERQASARAAASPIFMGDIGQVPQ